MMAGGRPWTPEEDAAILAARPVAFAKRPAYGGVNTEMERLAKRLGRSYAALRSRRSKLRKARREAASAR